MIVLLVKEIEAILQLLRFLAKNQSDDVTSSEVIYPCLQLATDAKSHFIPAGQFGSLVMLNSLLLVVDRHSIQILSSAVINLVCLEGSNRTAKDSIFDQLNYRWRITSRYSEDARVSDNTSVVGAGDTLLRLQGQRGEQFTVVFMSNNEIGNKAVLENRISNLLINYFEREMQTPVSSVVPALQGLSLGPTKEPAGGVKPKLSISSERKIPRKAIKKQQLFAPSVTPTSSQEAEQLKLDEMRRGEYLPTVYTSIYSNGDFKPMAANTRVGIPFETELLTGHVLLMINSGSPDNPFRERFSGAAQKYRMEIQVQGKFKRIPKGRLFMGAEVTKRMELGMIGKAMSGTILQIGKKVNAFMHHSFGDKKNFELPHITSPVWSTIDKLMITPAGQEPPALGVPFPETAESREVRRKNPDHNIGMSVPFESLVEGNSPAVLYCSIARCNERMNDSIVFV